MERSRSIIGKLVGYRENWDCVLTCRGELGLISSRFAAESELAPFMDSVHCFVTFLR